VHNQPVISVWAAQLLFFFIPEASPPVGAFYTIDLSILGIQKLASIGVENTPMFSYVNIFVAIYLNAQNE
jgi:hypothetical protein